MADKPTQPAEDAGRLVSSAVDVVRDGHAYLQREYPLAYEAAQILPGIGQVGAALDLDKAIRAGDKEGMAMALFSAVPILGRARMGKAIARSVGEVVDNAPTAIGRAKAIVKKVGAGENVAEAGEAGYAQGQLMRESTEAPQEVSYETAWAKN